jgi:hypothetical protein
MSTNSLRKVTVACLLAAVSTVATAIPAQASGTARLYLAPSKHTVAPGQVFSLQERITVRGDSVNAVQADLVYASGRAEYLRTSATGSAFDSSVIAFGGGARTSNVAVKFGSTGVTGDALVGTVSFRAGCTPGTTTLAYANSSAAVSRATATDILTGTAGSTITVGPLQPHTLCLTPSVRGRGALGQQIKLYGAGITAGSSVRFVNGGVSVKAVSVPAPGQLVATVAISPTAALGSSGVTVTNPDSTAVSCTSCFTVTDRPNPTSTTPSSFGRASTGTSASVSGSGFANAARVVVSGTGVTVTVDQPVATPGRLDVSVTVTGGATTGPRDVVVINADGGRGTCTSCLSVT